MLRWIGLLAICSWCAAQERPASECDAALEKAGSLRRGMMMARGVPSADRFYGAPERPLERSPESTRCVDIAARLARDYAVPTAVLFYVPATFDGLVDVFLILPGNADVRKSSFLRSELEQASKALRGSMYVETANSRALVAERRAQDGDDTVFDASNRKLSELLIPPAVASRLGGIENLIVAPCGVIGVVPFSLLRPFGNEAMLVDRMSVSIAPSIFDLLNPPEPWRFDLRTPLIAGNPKLPPNWPPLPGSEREAVVVARSLGATPILGEQANRDFVQQRAPDADLLYFATHGVGGGLSGFIAFSGTSDEGIRWDARTIQRMKLKARLAVLSGCQTGLGLEHDGGTIGLARAFQIAGVPHVLMSLWNVNDEATADLMTAFFEHARSVAPAQALRRAMIDVRKRHPKPSEWAPFTVLGLPR